jgi:small subunit ribosomal protein S8
MKKTEKTNKVNRRGTIIGYPVGDFLIRVKNAATSTKKEVKAPYTKLIGEVAKVLKNEGYIDMVEAKDREIYVKLTMRRKEPVLLGLELISTPGLRQYISAEELGLKRGPEMYILSTPQGVLASRAAIKKNVGGELIAKVW